MLMQEVEHYLAVRRAAGFQLKKVEKTLRSFVRFCVPRSKTHICTETALAWAAEGTSPAQRAFRLKTLVQFARYAQAENERHEIPPDDIFGGYQIRRRTPFIFTDEDINRLVGEASRLGPPGSLRPLTYSTLFALLAVTGMRVREALDLCLEDVNAEGLLIRNTKFGKSRFLPLLESTRTGLEKYLIRRRQVAGGDDHVFVSLWGRGLSYSAVQERFQTLVRTLKLHTRSGQPHPRLHDLRHSFATRALQACPEGRDSIARHMVALSTYLGHSQIRYTYWYLEATPQLMADIASACESFVHGGQS